MLSRGEYDEIMRRAMQREAEIASGLDELNEVINEMQAGYVHLSWDERHLTRLDKHLFIRRKNPNWQN